MRTTPNVLAAAILVTACAAAPDYREASREGAQGYTEQILEKDRYRVSYTGGPHQGAAEVQNLALLRAAELTMEKGGDWFEVVSGETGEDVSVKERFAGTGYTTGTALRRSCGLLGCTTSAYPVTVASDEFSKEEETVYDHELEIIIHQGNKPAGDTRAYDAPETAANLRATLD
ncbi:MAG: hypothetical protein R3B98_04680 [Hyphomonas sp.]